MPRHTPRQIQATERVATDERSDKSNERSRSNKKREKYKRNNDRLLFQNHNGWETQVEQPLSKTSTYNYSCFLPLLPKLLYSTSKPYYFDEHLVGVNMVHFELAFLTHFCLKYHPTLVVMFSAKLFQGHTTG